MMADLKDDVILAASFGNLYKEKKFYVINYMRYQFNKIFPL